MWKQRVNTQFVCENVMHYTLYYIEVNLCWSVPLTVWSHCWTVWRFHSNRPCNRFPILITNIQTSPQQKTNKYHYACKQKECLGELQWWRTLVHKYTSNAANSQWTNTKQWTISISQHWAHKPTLESTHESLNLCQGSTNFDIKINFTQSDVLIVVTLQYWHPC